MLLSLSWSLSYVKTKSPFDPETLVSNGTESLSSSTLIVLMAVSEVSAEDMYNTSQDLKVNPHVQNSHWMKLSLRHPRLFSISNVAVNEHYAILVFLSKVYKIINGGLADKDGRLKKGDRILSINGRSMRNVTHRESLILLRSPRSEVTIVASRPRGSEMVSSSSIGDFSSVFDKSNNGNRSISEAYLSARKHGC